ncbi:hypothetical protein [Priestia megaterium]|jgi:hypothetical protein|uniref:hypothetical protein n=1 Tax=Priestia megaterium TaxID=1404 RepID=UPI0028591D47|nr:hypothetical protein [Priestia megaterium]MDR7242697.1 hypothetical protein [Priestia megaterium]
MPIHSPTKRSIQEQAYLLAAEFKKTAIQRDKKGGNPRWERDLIRKSGLLNLLIPKRLGGMGKLRKRCLKLYRFLHKQTAR